MVKATDIIKQLALKNKLEEKEIEKLRLNHIYWEARANKFKIDHSVSWGDINVIIMEINNILQYIEDGDLVLDAGCSNGFSTLEIASKKDIKIRAFDYSEKSIEYAKKAQNSKDKDKKITFYHGNLLNITEPDSGFDKVYTIRVIINLLSWELQKKALLEIHRVLKPQGLYLMSEAFMGGFRNLNKLRKLGGLPPLKVQNYNLFLEEKKVEDFMKKYFDIISIKKFSSLYYIGSRFFRYLATNKSDKDSFVNDINNFFTRFEETDRSGDFGFQKLYVLKKKT